MVEFAIIVPILLTILLGIVQLGIVYNNWVSITDAARAGARKGAVCRTGCTPDATTATVNVVKNSAADLDQSSLGVTVTSTWAQGADVTVKASYPVVREHHGSRRRLGNDDGYDHRTGRIDGFRREESFLLKMERTIADRERRRRQAPPRNLTTKEG